ncbi:DUF5799 family protein [Natronobiforma cellulositropha]|uniref:DUF5799 family protein n=1 Tax=Natronobiforma cellulositropha TaxID=1679076 RepID=UPI0021D5D526|nr:DUF5799 family protein [Natronobiforma cellulositropha]
MSSDSWTDRIVGERMATDRDFTARIAASRFSSQEWSLIMTATEFELENPDDPEQARIVANTEKVRHVLPELENVRSQLGAMGAETSGGGSSGGGLLDSLKRTLGFGGEAGYEAEREAAEELTAEYARELQSTLEANGRFEEICRFVAEE